MTRWHVLAVDEYPANLETIRKHLADPAMQLDLAPDAERAWQYLRTAASPHDLVILNRTAASGMELLRRLKADPRLRTIPVIMQADATASESVREGVEAGAYYYLAKPYTPAALLAMVRAALADAEELHLASQPPPQLPETLRLLETAEFQVVTLTEATRLATLLATQCPAPDTAAMGLAELMINAIEHGNLGIGYAEKLRLKQEEAWEDEISRRLALPENRHKAVHVTVRRAADELVFTIRDDGQGFDWRRYLDFDPARAMDLNGRGIAMARKWSFTRLEYRGCGNEVVATIALPRPDNR